MLEAGGRTDPTRGVGPLRPHLSAWDLPSCWLSRSLGLAGESSLTLIWPVSGRGRGVCVEWSTCVFLSMGYVLCYTPESEKCARV